MMMPARTMHVAVCQFLLRGHAHIGDLHVEMQRDTGQRMVAIEGYDTILHTDHCEHPHFTTLITRLELHAGFHVLTAESIHRHFVYQRWVKITIALRSRHYGLHLITGLPAFELALQAGHDHLMALDVGEHVTASTGIQQLAIGIVQGVMEGDNGVLGNLHARKVGTGTYLYEKPRLTAGLSLFNSLSLVVSAILAGGTTHMLHRSHLTIRQAGLGTMATHTGFGLACTTASGSGFGGDSFRTGSCTGMIPMGMASSSLGRATAMSRDGALRMRGFSNRPCTHFGGSLRLPGAATRLGFTLGTADLFSLLRGCNRIRGGGLSIQRAGESHECE